MNNNNLNHKENHLEQVSKLAHFEILDICCEQIALKTTTKPVSEWTNGNYVKLSFLIKRKTKTHLSENTLKRIFGKVKTSEKYAPQKATLDALAQFLDFKDWYEFELAQQKATPKDNPTDLRSTANAQKINRPTQWIIIGLFIAALGVGTYALYKSTFWLPKLNLDCVNPDGSTPHSAIFKIKNINGSLNNLPNLFIDFADLRAKKSSFKDSVISHYYEIPGRYFPKLLYGDKIVDTAHVYVKSVGWTAIATAQNDTTRVYPIKNKDILSNELLLVKADEIFKAGIDTNKTFFINFCNVKPTSISADNFEFLANITTSAIRSGVRCSQVDVTIFGEKDKHTFNLIKPECVSWSSYKFSENTKSGATSDLRNLGVDLSRGAEVRLIVARQNVTLAINGNQILKTTCKKPVGKVMGLKITYAGIGRVNNVKLIDLKTGEIF